MALWQGSGTRSAAWRRILRPPPAERSGALAATGGGRSGGTRHCTPTGIVSSCGPCLATGVMQGLLKEADTPDASAGVAPSQSIKLVPWGLGTTQPPSTWGSLI